MAEHEHEHARAIERLRDDAAEAAHHGSPAAAAAYRAAADALEELPAVRAEIERLRAAVERVGEVLSANGCDCECDHYPEHHDDDCERCLGCHVDAALAGRSIDSDAEVDHA